MIMIGRKIELDEISSDIRSLEKVLKNGFVNKCSFYIDDFEFLCWDGHRIILKNIDYTKPLIETKFEIRLKYAKFLPDLLKKCMETIK